MRVDWFQLILQCTTCCSHIFLNSEFAMDDESDFDFLSLLNENNEVEVAVLQPERCALPVQPALVLPACDSEPQRVQGATPFSLPSMVGKVGSGRHGQGSDANMLALHMRHCKTMRRAHGFQQDVSDLLCNSTFMKDGQLVSVQARPSSTGLILKLQNRSTKGNRYTRIVPWSKFFLASYGKLIRSSHLAISLNVSRSTVNFMTNMMGCVFMGQQLVLLTKLIQLAREMKPKIVVQQFKWDETALLCSVDADKSGKRVRSSWQIMVARQRIVLVLPDGQTFVFRLVLPPIVLLGTTAQDIYYGVFHHPTFFSTRRLIDILASHCRFKFQVFESDGAPANLRLFAHLLNRSDEASPQTKSHMIHVLCQNHQSQLITVSLLAHVGSNLLNRLYGMTTFIRNLGYFMRMRQAVGDWMEENLVFSQQVMGIPLGNFVTPNPVLLELVDYLRQGRKNESDGSEAEAEVSSVFEKKAAFFLEMFNAEDLSGRPCHVCNHSACASQDRHCYDRQQAVQKCTEALVGLFLSSMPSIPSPNKWTTLFAPLSFVLGGFLVYQWLPEVFHRAFKGMPFAEFNKADESTDPRLVETLSFHAVTCLK